MLYDHGYTIKGVQKLLKTNGNKFVTAIASGDLATVESLAAANTEEHEPHKPISFEDDQIVGRAKTPVSRRFFGFGGGHDDSQDPSMKDGVGKEDRALLQEALYDLLECKRLLDQVR